MRCLLHTLFLGCFWAQCHTKWSEGWRQTIFKPSRREKSDDEFNDFQLPYVNPWSLYRGKYSLSQQRIEHHRSKSLICKTFIQQHSIFCNFAGPPKKSHPCMGRPPSIIAK